MPGVHRSRPVNLRAVQGERASRRADLAVPIKGGSRWQPQALGQLKLNLGGEGELRGYINLNPMLGNRRSLDEMLTADPTGAVIKAGAEAMPLPDGSAIDIRAQALPSVVLAEKGTAIGTEVIRVLANGGKATLHSRTPFTSAVSAELKALGYQAQAPNVFTFHKPLKPTE